MQASEEREGQFNVSVETSPGSYRVVLSGELDIATADQLTSALDGVSPANDERLVIDLTAVSFMDSTGLRVLIAANGAATEGGYELFIVTGDSPAKRVLELTRMDEHMQVVASI
ncbi:MAG: STAS domain-containing protein [Thermoleophilaceae bacterium]|nr:STAS domain-containing protein [Thermoleophilaceae bacterium]